MFNILKCYSQKKINQKFHFTWYGSILFYLAVWFTSANITYISTLSLQIFYLTDIRIPIIKIFWQAISNCDISMSGFLIPVIHLYELAQEQDVCNISPWQQIKLISIKYIPGAGRTQVGPMLAPWTLLTGISWLKYYSKLVCYMHSIIPSVNSLALGTTYGVLGFQHWFRYCHIAHGPMSWMVISSKMVWKIYFHYVCWISNHLSLPCYMYILIWKSLMELLLLLWCISLYLYSVFVDMISTLALSVNVKAGNSPLRYTKVVLQHWHKNKLIEATVLKNEYWAIYLIR